MIGLDERTPPNKNNNNLYCINPRPFVRYVELDSFISRELPALSLYLWSVCRSAKPYLL